MHWPHGSSYLTQNPTAALPAGKLPPKAKSGLEAGVSTWAGEMGFSVPQVCRHVGIAAGATDTASGKGKVWPIRKKKMFFSSVIPA